MAHDFGATFSEMEGAANKLRDGRSNISDTLKELQAIIDELVEDGFKTEVASGAYSQAYSDLTSSLDDASNAVDDMATALDAMAEKIKTQDADMAAG